MDEDSLFDEYLSTEEDLTFSEWLEERKGKVMDKKHWLVNGSKYDTYQLAEDEAKRKTAKNQAVQGIYELVASTQPVVPDINVVKIT